MRADIPMFGFNDDACANLLCYLVIAQLVARARTGAWLRTDHLVESTRIWLAGNGTDVTWEDRVRLGGLSETITPQFTVFPDLREADALIRLFTDAWGLDYRSPVVRGIYIACRNELHSR